MFDFPKCGPTRFVIVFDSPRLLLRILTKAIESTSQLLASISIQRFSVYVCFHCIGMTSGEHDFFVCNVMLKD